MAEFLRKIKRHLKGKSSKGFVIENNSNQSNDSLDNVSFSGPFGGPLGSIVENPIYEVPNSKPISPSQESSSDNLPLLASHEGPIRAHEGNSGFLDKIRYGLGLKSKQRGLIIPKGTEPIMASEKNSGFLNKIKYGLGFGSKRCGAEAANSANQLIVELEKIKTS
ncbi:MAG: hypothetical protein V4471_05620 [Pseudomonadota bacterium]